MNEVIKSIVQDSKKLGRIIVLVLTLVITGGLSFVAAFTAVEPMAIVTEILDKWFLILMAAVNFYFITKPTGADK